MDKHKHQCGFEEGVFDPEKGCGHVWEHEDSMLIAPKAIFAEAHTCPACGKGLWRSHLEPSSRVSSFGQFMLLGILEAALQRLESESEDYIEDAHGTRGMPRSHSSISGGFRRRGGGH